MYKKQRHTAVILCFVMLFACTFSYAAYAASLSEIQGNISDKKEQLEEGREKEQSLENDISSLEKKINGMQDEIDGLQSEINETEFKIREAEIELSELQEDISSQNDGLNARLRTMYENDNTSIIEVLLSSGSISEFLTNVELLKKIHQSDKKILSELKEQHEALEEKKAVLDELEASLQSKQSQLKTQQSSLESEKSSLNSRKQQVAASNSNLEEELADLQSAAAAITEQIKNYGNDGSSYGGGVMMWPCSGPVTCEYGYRYCPFHGYELHSGIDIAVPTGTSIKAAASGTVVQAYYNASYGNMILINNGGGIYTLYAHNSSLLVSAGTRVTKGQVIAKSGNTGNSTGPHCHFEVRKNGQPVNPRSYL
ncbi:MAG: peptidoglycan DD-metalloendopeptidase family protein [Clostridiales bacterium]|nr:peptidoglycan DD-metalloendopeptidase family protein [Clostridiales bacterium]